MMTCNLCSRIIIAGLNKDMLQPDMFVVDNFILCPDCFHMLLLAGLLFEGQDDEWHIIDLDAFELLL